MSRRPAAAGNLLNLDNQLLSTSNQPPAPAFVLILTEVEVAVKVMHPARSGAGKRANK